LGLRGGGSHRQTCRMAPSLVAWRDVEELPDFSHMASMPCQERARHSTLALQDVASSMDLPAWTSRMNAACFAATLDFEDVCTMANQHPFGVATESVQQIHEEAAMVVLAGALDFGSSWRDELRDFHGKGTWPTVKQGVESMSNLCPELKAEWLFSLSEKAIAMHFGLDRAEHLGPFVSKLHQVVHEIGEKLVTNHVPSMADYIIKFLEEVRGDQYAASKVIQELADMFPLAFQDVAYFKRLPIYFYKKAQEVVCELHERFHLLDDRFNFADVDMLTANVDPLVIAVLRKHQVVKTTWELARNLDENMNLTTGGAAEVSLRAAATAALEDMAWLAKLKGFQVSPMMLGNYLWGCLGKSEAYMFAQRHVNKDTSFY